VGDSHWNKWLSKVYELLSEGEGRYYGEDQLDEAWDWIQSGL
jgi:hypothetical protein